LDFGRVYEPLRTLCSNGKPGKGGMKATLVFESLGEIRTLVVKGEKVVDDGEEGRFEDSGVDGRILLDNISPSPEINRRFGGL